MRWLTALTLVAVAFTSCSREPSKRTQQQLADLQKKKEAAAQAAKEKREKQDAPPEAVHVDAPYDETQALVVTPDGKCPEGLWALFPQLVPGATPEEKKASEARRKTLADGLSKRTILVKLRAPSSMTLQPFDAPNGRFVIEVPGTIDCTDVTGRIALSWTDTKAIAPPTDNEVAQNVWQASPVRFELPMKELSEAKAFYEGNRFKLSARVVFTPGKVEIDKKMKHVSKVSEKALGETLGYGGGAEDWGAGPLLRGQLIGVRVATDGERRQLFDQRKP